MPADASAPPLITLIDRAFLLDRLLKVARNLRAETKDEAERFLCAIFVSILTFFAANSNKRKITYRR